MNIRISRHVVVLSVLFLTAVLPARSQTPTQSKGQTGGATQREVPPATPVRPGPARPSPGPARPAEAATGTATLLDINSATKADLMKLPGIGEALSQRIIDGRPYRAKNELTQKNIIPEATYTRISDLIIAKQTTAPATAKPTTPSATGKEKSR